ncbi:hypothetical protein [Spartinivicinus ruber]|uniref:hypothetical protein n=1 Tax=Spartinivicinus ruber TaxID=2683272 RepID=UPI0013D674FB|nr:hypothetical protein [Spartinivicinus ruber]
MSTSDKQVEERLQQEIRNNEQAMDELKEQLDQLSQLKQQIKQLGVLPTKEDLTPVQQAEFEKQMAAFNAQLDHDEEMIKSHSRANPARVFKKRLRGLKI